MTLARIKLFEDDPDPMVRLEFLSYEELKEIFGSVRTETIPMITAQQGDEIVDWSGFGWVDNYR